MLSMEELKELIEDTKSKRSTAQTNFLTKQQEVDALQEQGFEFVTVDEILFG